jgi:hypothetical protein
MDTIKRACVFLASGKNQRNLLNFGTRDEIVTPFPLRKRGKTLWHGQCSKGCAPKHQPKLTPP